MGLLKCLPFQQTFKTYLLVKYCKIRKKKYFKTVKLLFYYNVLSFTLLSTGVPFHPSRLDAFDVSFKISKLVSYLLYTKYFGKVLVWKTNIIFKHVLISGKVLLVEKNYLFMPTGKYNQRSLYHSKIMFLVQSLHIIYPFIDIFETWLRYIIFRVTNFLVPVSVSTSKNSVRSETSMFFVFALFL